MYTAYPIFPPARRLACSVRVCDAAPTTCGAWPQSSLQPCGS